MNMSEVPYQWVDSPLIRKSQNKHRAIKRTIELIKEQKELRKKAINELNQELSDIKTDALLVKRKMELLDPKMDELAEIHREAQDYLAFMKSLKKAEKKGNVQFHAQVSGMIATLLS